MKLSRSSQASWPQRVRRFVTIPGLVLALSVLPFAGSTAPAAAAELTTVAGGVSYSVDTSNPHEAQVTGFDASTVHVEVLPNVTISDVEYPVTSIATGVFNAQSVSSASLPEGLTHIGGAAFAYNDLTDLALPSTLVEVGPGAFMGNELTHLELPSSVHTVDALAFALNRLEAAVLPDQLSTLGAEAFRWNLIESITVPGSIPSVEDGAFRDNKLTSVTVQEGATSIGKSAFQGNWLTEVNLPDSLEEIGDGAFRDNTLEAVRLPARVRHIGENAFGANGALRSVSFAGPAPTLTPAGNNETFQSSSKLTLHVLREHMVPSASDGFTSPKWMGYNVEPGTYLVTFETNGGTTLETAEVVTGGQLSLPDAPERLGHEFAGWFTNEELTQAFNIETPITQDITLYAAWTTATYVVSFDTGEGAEVSPIQVKHGELLPTLQSPHRPGHDFFGWFYDTDHTQEVDKERPVTGDMTLYALWVPVEVELDGLIIGIDPNNPEKGAAVIDYRGPNGVNLVIPATVRINGVDYPVTTIRELVLAHQGFTSVRLPETVTEIQDFAFWGNNLRQVTLPSGLTHLGMAAFAESEIEQVSLPDSLRSIEDGAFIGNKLTEVTIPASIAHIRGRAFEANPIESVRFLGSAPQIWGANESSPSFDPSDKMTFYVKKEFTSHDPEEGFTLPTWNGYNVKLMSHSVSFKTDSGSKIDPVSVTDGSLLALPQAPQKDEHEFLGWFTDKSLQTAFDPASPITTDLTLYAAWRPTPPITTPDAKNSIVQLGSDRSATAGENIVFTLSRENAKKDPWTGEASVMIHTVDGNGKSGRDYVAVSEELVWAAGDNTAKTVVVQTKASSTGSPSEERTFTLQLSSPGKHTEIGERSEATGTIIGQKEPKGDNLAATGETSLVPLAAAGGLLLLAGVQLSFMRRQRRKS